MADYNLNGLNPRDFQHLIQALARKRIAAGVTSFGDGKDGNRDLAYHGKMDYPSTDGAWDGYLVLGCKFNQRPTGNTHKDADWAINQLTTDLKKFLKVKRKLPKPEYYIFVTNIVLTGVADVGGRDRMMKVLEEYKPKLGLKGSAAWDYNDIRGFLDGDKDIRAAYGHFITAGDVLVQVIEILSLQRADFAEVMHTFLQKELLADMSAKLQSAGEDPEVQIPLANVFVDLPVAESAEAAALSQGAKDADQPKIIKRLLEAGACVLRRQPPEHSVQSEDEPGVRTPSTSRFVLVGGPGQGKSTLAQYLCQLYRAAILKDWPHYRLDEKVTGIIKQLADQREEAGGLPIARRFPVRVELRAFSSALANNSNLTLLEYLRVEISRLGSAAIQLEELKKWLGLYPWLLVLDGLDEVPPSSNREDVMRQVEDFRIDAASQNADILLVATTRPQSYSKEFSSDLFQHLYLTPLSPKQALDYGRRLAQARCRTDERRCDELVRSLEKACQTEATARLMQSPLQVTIMATLLEETGDPPQQRYRLFAEYYRTIYKRETRRGMFGGILSERPTDIDIIHKESGLLLHAAGERAAKPNNREKDSDSESSFSDEQFRELARRRLARIQVPELKASDLVKRITDSSVQRLVFLVRPKEGWVQFDIPSFKEFMAAEALMTGRDEHIRERLKTVASADYWRNVLLFAVGKCLIEKEYLLDNIVSVCEGLNDDKGASKLFSDETAGATSKAILWGSRLALDILTEGTVRQNPEYESRLAKIALALVRVADLEAAARLAAIYHSDLTQVFKEAVGDWIDQSDFSRQRGAWLLLMSLADRDVEWAMQMLERLWPQEPAKQQVLLLSRRNSPMRSWSIAKLVDIIPSCDPIGFFNLRRRQEILRVKFDRSPDWWQAAINVLSDPYSVIATGRRIERIEIQNKLSFFPNSSSFLLTLTGEKRRNPLMHLQTLPFHHPGWAPFISAARFWDSPTPEVLRNELHWLAQNWTPYRWYWSGLFPWPLAACLRTAKTKDDLRLLAEKAANGKLGKLETWASAETRWVQMGITDDDFQAMSDARWPFDERIGEIGFPFAACSWSLRGNKSQLQTEELLKQFRRIPSSLIKTWMASEILDLLSSFLGEDMSPVSLTDFQELLSVPSGDWRLGFDFDWLPQLKAMAQLSSEWVDFLDQMGRQQVRFYGRGTWPGTEQLVHRFVDAPEVRRGLLPLLGALAVAGNKCEVPREILQVCREWGDNTKDTVVLLRLARGDWTSDEAHELAKDIVESEVARISVLRAFRILRERFPMDRAASFALVLFQQLQLSTREGCEALEEVISVLTEYLNQRPSLLHDANVWRKLDLPERI